MIEILVWTHIAIAFLVTIVLSFIFGWDDDKSGVGSKIIVIAILWPLALTSAVTGWLAHKMAETMTDRSIYKLKREVEEQVDRLRRV